MAQNIDQILTHAVTNGYNVLMKGAHGVGKTAMVQACFEAAGLKWKYYSASTMDPWVDFIGVPKEKTDEKGMTYLDLVRPRDLAADEVEAIFFDELNRAHKKIRNAVMELIQFKSINGKKFKNLKIVWAAINPDDDAGTYDVEKLDPAQIDRFQVHIDVPNEPSASWFKKTFGPQGERAVKWWNTLDVKIQALVSPRRLEYALNMLNTGGDVRMVLDGKANVTNFTSTMTKGDPLEVCNDLIKKNPAEVSRFLMDGNNFKHVSHTIFTEERFLRTLVKYLPKEVLLKELIPRTGVDNKKLVAHVSNNADVFDSLTDDILSNVGAYPATIKSGFENHRARKQRMEREALNSSAKMMEKLNNLNKGIGKRPIEDEYVDLNKVKIRVGDLTIDNYESMTNGRRFRVTKPQQDRITAGTLTREEALKEFLAAAVSNGGNEVTE
jgi:hypothetical protein